MAMKTRAAVTVGPRKVEMREIPVPETNEDTGLVRIELTGDCQYCLSGHYYLCGGKMMEKMYGFTSLDVGTGLWGGFSEVVYLDPQALIHKISDSVPAEVAPLYLAIANGIRWVHGEAEIGIGDTVVILGPGQLGLSCVVAAKEAGAACIIVTGRERDAARM